ncbi:conserved hypothetical protein [Streptomyces clavuligerus]|nr:conserved hypothetical protein [Streptomyces clavuligerus]
MSSWPRCFVNRAGNRSLRPAGEGGLPQQLPERVLGSALEGEITDHLGYGKRAAEDCGSP